MPLTPQFLIHGIDFTGLGPTATASQHNTLVDSGLIAPDKAIVLVTTDTALNTPDTPDTATYPIFKSHLWLRLPYNATYSPVLYCWFNNTWTTLIVDISALTALALAASLKADQALALANATNANLNSIAAIANQAAIDATNAQTTATNASATATSALAIATANNGLGLHSAVSQTLQLSANGPDILTFAHGLSGTPLLVRAVLICLAQDAALYTINEEVDSSNFTVMGQIQSPTVPPSSYTIISERITQAIQVSSTASTITAIASVGVSAYQKAFRCLRKTDGVAVDITDRTKWALRVYAFAR